MTLQELIETLGALEGVRSVLLASKDGLVVASTFKPDGDDELHAALTAALLGAMDRTTQRIGLGKTLDSMLQTDDCAVQIMDVDEFVLVVVSDKLFNIEEVRRGMRRVAEGISALSSE